MNDLQLSPTELEDDTCEVCGLIEGCHVSGYPYDPPEDTHWQDNGLGYCVHCAMTPAGHEHGSARCMDWPTDPDDVPDPIEYEECPTHGKQLVRGYGSTGGPDPYTKTLLACGDAVICLGPGDPMILCGTWRNGDLVPAKYR